MASSRVVDAVECGVAVQRSLAERNEAVLADERIHVRIGINLGEVIVDGKDRYGEGVNIATRLEQRPDRLSWRIIDGQMGILIAVRRAVLAPPEDQAYRSPR